MNKFKKMLVVLTLFILSVESVAYNASSISLLKSELNSTKVASVQVEASKKTAKCNDGTISYSETRQGACSGPDGVAEWFEYHSNGKVKTKTEYHTNGKFSKKVITILVENIH